jgi:hypothetical protein
VNEWEWQLLEDKTHLDVVIINSVELRPGYRVRLKPRGRKDIFDLALTGKTAVIEAIEEDYEGQVHLAVVLDDDPGKDLGMLRQPGHRFFFSVEEVEPLSQSAKEERD